MNYIHVLYTLLAVTTVTYQHAASKASGFVKHVVTAPRQQKAVRYVMNAQEREDLLQLFHTRNVQDGYHHLPEPYRAYCTQRFTWHPTREEQRSRLKYMLSISFGLNIALSGIALLANAPEILETANIASIASTAGYFIGSAIVKRKNKSFLIFNALKNYHALALRAIEALDNPENDPQRAYTQYSAILTDPAYIRGEYGQGIFAEMALQRSLLRDQVRDTSLPAQQIITPSVQAYYNAAAEYAYEQQMIAHRVDVGN